MCFSFQRTTVLVCSSGETGRSLLFSGRKNLSREVGRERSMLINKNEPFIPGDCPLSDGQWQCILPAGHKDDHVLGNKFNFRQSKTVPQSADSALCTNTWTNLRCDKPLDHEGPCHMTYDFDYVEPIGPKIQSVEDTRMTPIALPASTEDANHAFPFTLDDLDYWVIKRKDGIVAKYVVQDEATYNKNNPPKVGTVQRYPAASGSQTVTPFTHFSDICKHPGEDAIWKGDKIQIHICNAVGMRDNWKKFDTVIDCGHILNMEAIATNRLLRGTDWLVDELVQFGYDYIPNILRIDWEDREAPLLDPAFWPALVKNLEGKVATACQGGHGRSGTSLVCMLMVLAPDYTPYDAICHLRALHCGRAIESKVQHEYIDEVGVYLKREKNAAEVSGVKDFKAAFMKIDRESAKPYQEALKNQPAKGKK